MIKRGGSEEGGSEEEWARRAWSQGQVRCSVPRQDAFACTSGGHNGRSGRYGDRSGWDWRTMRNGVGAIMSENANIGRDGEDIRRSRGAVDAHHDGAATRSWSPHV
jgi:hypothetical protein